MKKPDILLILWHDLGRHLSCFNAGSVSTPHLDRMAEEGVLFTEYFSPGGVCVPSRCSILSGRYPHANGIWRFDETERALPAMLREGGYHTVRFGFREEGEFFPPDGEVDRALYARDILGYTETRAYIRDSHSLAGDVCRYLSEYEEDRPLYACIQFSDIHRPNEAEVDRETLARTEIPRNLPDLPRSAGSLADIASFEARCRRADEAVGKILEYLRESGKKDNTLVLFSSDHGLDLPRAKLTLYDAGTGVAMIGWGHRSVASGIRTDRLSSHVDILPTLLDFAGLPAAENIQGLSFAPHLRGEAAEEHSFVLMEKSWESPMRPMRAVRTKRYKYIRNYCPGYPMDIPPDYVRKAGEQVRAIYGGPVPYEQLYDVERDPNERHNLAGDASCGEALRELSELLDQALERGGDPIRSTAEYMAFLRRRLL